MKNFSVKSEYLEGCVGPLLGGPGLVTTLPNKVGGDRNYNRATDQEGPADSQSGYEGLRKTFVK